MAGKLTLEEIQDCNNLTKEEMANIMGVRIQKYIYYLDHPNQIDTINMIKMCRGLNIGIQYIKIGH